MKKLRTMKECKQLLALLWFIGGGSLIALMFAQTLLGRYQNSVVEAWGWLLPNVMPTLSLIIGVLVADQAAAKPEEFMVSQFLFRLIFCLSLFYISLLFLTLLLDPVSPMPLTVVFGLSDVWLGPLQGVVAAGLGFFYVRREKP